MKLVAKVAGSIAVLAFTLAGARVVRAADTKAVVTQIEAHDKAFIAAYEAGNTAKMKSESAKAVALGEKNGLLGNAVMADAYVLEAILEVDGKDNTPAGVRAFGKALKIKPDVAIPEGMATSSVKAALKQARAAAGVEPKEKSGATPAATVATAAAVTPKAPEAPAPAAAKAEPKAEVKEATNEVAETSEAAKQVAALNARIAQLEKDKADRDKQLADAKAHAAELERDKAERDKQLAALTARTAQLEKDKADRNKQVADRDREIGDAKTRAQQLERDKVQSDKQLADARAAESKERDAREKIEHERQVAETQQKEAAAKRQQEQQDRERLFAGPAMPTHLTEPLHCEVPDEAPLRTDLFVHCVARPNVKARTIVFYYRAGEAHYDSVRMERTAKGWYAAIVPGARVVGKSMQYYAEALDARDGVVARNGKEASPNILSLRPSAPRG
jgi:hypothetical protein